MCRPKNGGSLTEREGRGETREYGEKCERLQKGGGKRSTSDRAESRAYITPETK